MNPAELFWLFAGFSDYPKHLSVQREFINSTGVSIRRIQHLVWSRRYTNRPRRAVLRRCRFSRRHVSLCGTRGGIERHVDRIRSNKGSIRVEYLDPAIASI